MQIQSLRFMNLVLKREFNTKGYSTTHYTYLIFMICTTRLNATIKYFIRGGDDDQ